jgi:hypothetical protein
MNAKHMPQRTQAQSDTPTQAPVFKIAHLQKDSQSSNPYSSLKITDCELQDE